LGCGKPEQRRAFQIGLGVRLAVRDVGGGDHAGGERQSGGPDADFCQAASAGGDDGPAIWGKAGEQGDRAGQGDDACEVGDFTAFDFAIFDGVVGVGQVVADRGEAGTAVGAGDDFFGIESVFDGPLMPDAIDGGSGVDEDSVEVEEQGAGLDLGHALKTIPYCGG